MKAQVEDDALSIEDFRSVFTQLKSTRTSIGKLESRLSRFQREVKSLDHVISSAKAGLVKYRKDRKKSEESLHSGIDRILAAYGIKRAAYHGGDLNGVHIRRLMHNAGEIMDVIEKYLVENKSKECKKTDLEIGKHCADMKLSLTLWDSAFSIINETDPSAERCNEAQLRIDMAVAQFREMGMSITPKVHGMEDHVVDLMRHIPGGIAMVLEHWVEQHHQVGYNNDMTWRNLSNNMKRQAEVW